MNLFPTPQHAHTALEHIHGLRVDMCSGLQQVVLAALREVEGETWEHVETRHWMPRTPFRVSAHMLKSHGHLLQGVTPARPHDAGINYSLPPPVDPLSQRIDRVLGDALCGPPPDTFSPVTTVAGLRVGGSPDGWFDGLPVEIKTVTRAAARSPGKLARLLLEASRQLAVYQHCTTDEAPTPGCLVLVLCYTGYGGDEVTDVVCFRASPEAAAAHATTWRAWSKSPALAPVWAACTAVSEAVEADNVVVAQQRRRAAANEFDATRARFTELCAHSVRSTAGWCLHCGRAPCMNGSLCTHLHDADKPCWFCHCVDMHDGVVDAGDRRAPCMDMPRCRYGNACALREHNVCKFCHCVTKRH